MNGNFKNKILLGNALELIRDIPSNSVDLILTDPPYGLGFGEFDNSEVFYEIENELWRVLKPNSFLVFYWSIKKLYEPFQKLKLFNFCWQIICYFLTTYSKSIVGSKRYIPILVYGKGLKPKVKYKHSDFIYALELPFITSKIGNVLFKPTGATSQLLQMFSREGDLVLDPFAGFGSILLSCKIWKRNFVGFEIDKRVFEIAKKIIETCKVTTIGKIPVLYDKQKELIFAK